MHDRIQALPDVRLLFEELFFERSLTPYISKSVISLPPDSIGIVCRGVVQLTTLQPNGNEVLLGLIGPSMPLGLPMTYINPYQATALTDVDMLWLSLPEIESSPTLAAGLFRHMTLRVLQAESWLALSGMRPVSERLRHLLTLLARQLGQPTGDDNAIRLSVRLTHEQLANAIGTTRVTVTRLLNTFCEEGWLCVDRQRHMVISPEGLM
ncbi:MAG: Crp/Fnr family transcriptional regulator [Cyanobacteria bacterium J06642_2]